MPPKKIWTDGASVSVRENYDTKHPYIRMDVVQDLIIALELARAVLVTNKCLGQHLGSHIESALSNARS